MSDVDDRFELYVADVFIELDGILNESSDLKAELNTGIIPVDVARRAVYTAAIVNQLNSDAEFVIRGLFYGEVEPLPAARSVAYYIAHGEFLTRKGGNNEDN